ncbi:MAG: leucine--tRNA ligase [Deltaproteobacteria bacterium]|nr:MAG: leucine--tRNA ligase [Deltaproteobacteria bacterium]
MISDDDNKDGAARYDHAEVEARWQAYWDDHQTFKATRRPGKSKRYVLDMFPYPSGAGLHVGHPEGYTATDIMARYWRMCGHDVLHPMGWDAFGLPAEQYAIKTGTHPAETTAKNVQVFKRQLKTLGFSYDWSREIDTTDPDYVRWTQWIFLKLFERGLAYQEKVSVNWCPALGTVLANEEVIDGKSERGAHPVERRPLRQWLLKITAYAERLAADLDQVDWPDGTMAMQKEWIGRSEGAEAHFAIQGLDGEGFQVFTTRPDTLFGATYCVLAPEHPLVAMVTTEERRAEVDRYVGAAINRAERDRIAAVKDKTGVFTGGYAINPVNDQPVPIWVADYVLMTYGTGAIMAVPAHDDRDWAFATKFDLPIIEVIQGGDVTQAAYTDHDHGVVVNSGFLDGLEPPAAMTKISQWLEDKGLGQAKVQYKLRDWVFSRQRYWGEPFPIYFPVTLTDPAGDPRTGTDHEIHYDQPIAVAESELPLRLPELEDFAPGDEPAGALARVVDWRYFQRDGQWYARETNTMPQWAGSCWYYLRFTDPHNTEQGWSEQADADWLPVDLYVGGAEHAVLHLLYARFWHKVLYDIGAVKHPEPFIKLVHQGMILGEDGEKMSKARGNVINPDDIVAVHGADAMRMYEMFMGPLEAVKPWQTSQIQGVVRFRDRVCAVCSRPVTDDWDEETQRLVHKTVKKVTADVERMAFNTALSALMVLTNHLMGLDPVPRRAAEALCRMMSPFTPHLGEELWRKLGHDDTITFAPWPHHDDGLCTDDTIEMGVQVNGKTRGTVTLSCDADAEVARAAALAVPTVCKHVEGKEVKKFIFVPKRIINFVVR